MKAQREGREMHIQTYIYICSCSIYILTHTYTYTDTPTHTCTADHAVSADTRVVARFLEALAKTFLGALLNLFKTV